MAGPSCARERSNRKRFKKWVDQRRQQRPGQVRSANQRRMCRRRHGCCYGTRYLVRCNVEEYFEEEVAERPNGLEYQTVRRVVDALQRMSIYEEIVSASDRCDCHVAVVRDVVRDCPAVRKVLYERAVPAMMASSYYGFSELVAEFHRYRLDDLAAIASKQRHWPRAVRDSNDKQLCLHRYVAKQVKMGGYVRCYRRVAESNRLELLERTQAYELTSDYWPSDQKQIYRHRLQQLASLLQREKATTKEPQSDNQGERISSRWMDFQLRPQPRPPCVVAYCRNANCDHRRDRRRPVVIVISPEEAFYHGPARAKRILKGTWTNVDARKRQLTAVQAAKLDLSEHKRMAGLQ